MISNYIYTLSSIGSGINQRVVGEAGSLVGCHDMSKALVRTSATCVSADDGFEGVGFA
jgi:hypothetical protein